MTAPSPGAPRQPGSRLGRPGANTLLLAVGRGPDPAHRADAHRRSGDSWRANLAAHRILVTEADQAGLRRQGQKLSPIFMSKFCVAFDLDCFPPVSYGSSRRTTRARRLARPAGSPAVP